jgi:hypothetical protein
MREALSYTRDQTETPEDDMTQSEDIFAEDPPKPTPDDIKAQMATADEPHGWEMRWKLSDAIEAGMTDEVMDRVKKKFRDAMDDLENDLDFGLKERLSSNLSDFICSSAENAVKQLLAGNEDRMRSYLSAQDGGYTGRERDHTVSHGKLFETGPLELRKKIVEAHAELLKTERILDLESQVASLVAQVNKLENRNANLNEELRGYRR